VRLLDFSISLSAMRASLFYARISLFREWNLCMDATENGRITAHLPRAAVRSAPIPKIEMGAAAHPSAPI
jgi:hypothetical protein